jgi:arylsulfatase A-like enzyme
MTGRSGARGTRGSGGSLGAGPIRNVLVIMSDQHRADVGGWAGDTWAHTPNLDALASQSAIFERAYTPSPVCVPARQSLLTGRYPHAHGATGNSQAASASEVTVAHLARDAGMATGAIGKMHFVGADRHRGFDVRWDREEYGAEEPEAVGDAASGMASPGLYGRRSEGRDLPVFADTNPVLIHHGNYDAGPSPFPAARHIEARTTDEALRFLEANHDGRWVLWCSYFKPHGPFSPPAEQWDEYAGVPLPVPTVDDRALADMPAHLQRSRVTAGYDQLDEAGMRERIAGYYGNLSFVDREVGRLLAAVDSYGLRDETLIIYTSDHGEMLGERGLFAKSNYYEPSWRVPLFIRHPDLASNGARIVAPVCLTDLMPTIAEVACLPTPENVQGTSLLPLMNGGGTFSRRYVYGELGARGPAPHKAVADDEWKLAVYADREHLFHLAADPHEQQNLIQLAPERATELRQALAHWEKETAH